MEYLLREKLEKLVQSQIEARMASYRKDARLLDPKSVATLKVSAFLCSQRIRCTGGYGTGPVLLPATVLWDDFIVYNLLL